MDKAIRRGERMIAVDTNVLVRILVDDKAQIEQVKKARHFAEKHQQLISLKKAGGCILSAST